MAGTIPLSTYRTYVGDLGVADLSDTILTQALNTAQNEITATRLWNFRISEFDVSGGSDNIPDLGTIITATYGSDPVTYTLNAVDKRDLEDQGCDLATTGDFPICYFLEGASTVTSYPLADFTVRYYANPTEMSASGDFSIIPDEMQSALIYQAGGHAFARVGILDLSQNFFNLAKQTLDSFDTLYSNEFIADLPVRYPANEA